MPNEWMDDAVCATTDPEVFFPENLGSAAEAKKICATCPVVQECLAYALENGFDDGVWGGTAGYERRKIRGRRIPGIGRRAQRIQDMEQFLLAGMSAEEIAESFKCSMDSMLRWCERVGRNDWARLFRNAA